VLQSQLSGKENEVFEINFEVKGMASKLKLLETERDELQASDSRQCSASAPSVCGLTLLVYVALSYFVRAASRPSATSVTEPYFFLP
jgi:hypothetical protein